MKYKNRKNGTVIETNSKLSGIWEVYQPSNNSDTRNEIKEELKEKVQKEVQEEVNKESTSNKKINIQSNTIDGVTVADIKKELDAFGIKYNPKSTKLELWNLMKESR